MIVSSVPAKRARSRRRRQRGPASTNPNPVSFHHSGRLHKRSRRQSSRNLYAALTSTVFNLVTGTLKQLRDFDWLSDFVENRTHLSWAGIIGMLFLFLTIYVATTTPPTQFSDWLMPNSSLILFLLLLFVAVASVATYLFNHIRRGMMVALIMVLVLYLRAYAVVLKPYELSIVVSFFLLLELPLSLAEWLLYQRTTRKRHRRV